MGWREEIVLLRQGSIDQYSTRLRSSLQRLLCAQPIPRLLIGTLPLTSGCASVLDLNHDYTIRSDSSGGISGHANTGGNASGASPATGGVTAQGAGNSTSGPTTLGGKGGIGGFNSVAASAGSLGSSSPGSGGFSAAGYSSVTATATGGVSAGGGASSGVTTGGITTGGTSTARTSTGGIGAAGATSSAIGSGGVGTGGSASSRSSSGGIGTGGASSTRANIGGTGAATASSAGNGGGSGMAGSGNAGGSDCSSCDHGITLQSESASAQRGSNSSSGVTYSSYQDRCPSNQVLVGYAGTLRDDVYQVNSVPVLQLSSLLAICGTVTLTATGEVTVTPSSGLTPRGTDSAAGTLSQVCPTNQVVVGFAGHSGTIIDQIGFVCASLTSNTSACCCSTLSVGTTYSFSPVGGTGGSAYSISCPTGQIALGQSLYTATTTKHVGEEWVSLFGLLCGTPVPIAACGS